jgi:LmbE family N-acetylglucosaminyl deacetylase
MAMKINDIYRPQIGKSEFFITEYTPKPEINNGEVLVIAPHADDAELSCGITMQELRGRGMAVNVLTLSDGCMSDKLGLASPRFEQAICAAQSLGVNEGYFSNITDTGFRYEESRIYSAVANAINACKPTTVITPWVYDIDADHRFTTEVVLRAACSVRNILFSRGLNAYDFIPDFFIHANGDAMQRKVDALKYYEEQVRRGTISIDRVLTTDHYTAIGSNHFRLTEKIMNEVGVANITELFAEGFKVHRLNQRFN